MTDKISGPSTDSIRVSENLKEIKDHGDFEYPFVVHIEKAYADIQGAYPIINQQFVLHEAADYRYINREEDTGAEGLRKAKLSYYPVFLQEKGVVTTK